jgi:hypothetical protein
VNEPANRTASVDRFEDTWVRDDDTVGRDGGTWWPLTDGPGWDEWARGGVGQAPDWSQVEEYGPFTRADAQRTTRALERVRQEAAR